MNQYLLSSCCSCSKKCTNSVSFPHMHHRRNKRIRRQQKHVVVVGIVCCYISLLLLLFGLWDVGTTTITITSADAATRNPSSSSSSSSSTVPRNPYTILGISPTTSSTTAKDIKRTYYQLCLKYHPDKLQHLPKKQRQKYEQTFKDIQWAYSELASGNFNHHHHQQQQQRSSSMFTTTGNPLNDYHRTIFEQYRKQQQHQYTSSRHDYTTRNNRHTLYRSFHHPFGNQNNNNNNMQSSTTTPFSNATPKFLFRQHVTIPLSDLYTGQPQYQFVVVSSQNFKNIVSWIIAAFRGGIGPYLLYQSVLYALPFLRFSKIGSFAIFVYMFYLQLPKIQPDEINECLVADLLPGYKGGTTKIIFSSDIIHIPDVEVQVILQEDHHPIYHRINNDLYVTCTTVSTKQATNGCTIQISSLRNKKNTFVKILRRRQTKQRLDDDNENDFVSIDVPPNTKSGDVIRIVGKGWPIRSKQRTTTLLRYGDLFVTIHIQPPPLSSDVGNQWFNPFRRRRHRRESS